jgi:hypothetical protein
MIGFVFLSHKERGIKAVLVFREFDRVSQSAQVFLLNCVYRFNRWFQFKHGYL